MASRNRDYFTLTAHQKPTVGDTKFSVIQWDHMGWLKCDGRSLSKNEYYFLWQIIGYSFGGSGDNFTLPNPAGRVPGVIGSNTETSFWSLGDISGQETHTLTIGEMPSHNHGTDVTTSNLIAGNGVTGSNGNHSHGITDPGHYHGYFNQPNTANPAVSATTTGVADNDNVNQITDTKTTGITINSNGEHNHTIATQGGSNAHNNMQPTIFMGNMFIYSGKSQIGYFPYDLTANVL